MRKARQRKRRSCGCKPHRIGFAVRWTPRDFERLRADEREVRTATMAPLPAAPPACRACGDDVDTCDCFNFADDGAPDHYADARDFADDLDVAVRVTRAAYEGVAA